MRYLKTKEKTLNLDDENSTYLLNCWVIKQSPRHGNRQKVAINCVCSLFEIDAFVNGEQMIVFHDLSEPSQSSRNKFFVVLTC